MRGDFLLSILLSLRIPINSVYEILIKNSPEQRGLYAFLNLFESVSHRQELFGFPELNHSPPKRTYYLNTANIDRHIQV